MEEAIKRTKAKVTARKVSNSVIVNVALPFNDNVERRVKFMLSEIEMASEGSKSSIKFFSNSDVDFAVIDKIREYFSVEEVTEGNKEGWLVTW